MSRKSVKDRQRYISKDPEKRKSQLSNLTERFRKSKKRTAFLTDPRNRNILYFLEHYYRLEDNEPIRLEDWQKDDILNKVWPPGKVRQYEIIILGMPKKSGKSTLSSGLALHALFFPELEVASPEIYIIATTEPQARIIYSKVCRAIKRSPEMRKSAKVYKDRIETPFNEGILRVLSSDVDSSEGLNPSAVFCDEASLAKWELWASLLSGMTARKRPFGCITTTAGYDTSSPFFKMFERAEKGEEPDTFYYWQNEYKASWVRNSWLEKQKKRLTSQLWERYHCNKWSNLEESFISLESWDLCVHPAHRQYSPDKSVQLVCGVDLGIKRDSSAAVALTRDSQGIKLIHHRIFDPPRRGKLRLSRVEDYIKWLSENFNLRAVIYDPWQFERMSETLRELHIRTIPFDQTVANLTAMSTKLSEIVENREIILYSDKKMRSHIEFCTGKATERGLRIIKKKSGKPIDAVIALGMGLMEIHRIYSTSRPGTLVGPARYKNSVSVEIGKPSFGSPGSGIAQPIGSRYEDPTTPREKSRFARQPKDRPLKVDYDEPDSPGV